MNKNDKEFIVQKIRTQYTDNKDRAVDELKRLDAKVKRPANVFVYLFGGIGAVIMGSGMSLVMTDIGNFLSLSGTLALIVGIITGVLGIILVGCAYPLYNCVVRLERQKIAPEILALTDELLK